MAASARPSPLSRQHPPIPWRPSSARRWHPPTAPGLRLNNEVLLQGIRCLVARLVPGSALPGGAALVASGIPKHQTGSRSGSAGRRPPRS